MKNNMDEKSLEKTYGIRIPDYDHKDYYLKTLMLSDEKKSLMREIEAYERFLFSLDDETEKSLKFKLIDKSVSYLKPIISEKVQAWIAPEKFELETNEFKPESGKTYISFDVKQANWSVTKYFLGLDLPVWEEYSRDVLGFHEALSYSKPLRQAILGQVVNPKRYDIMQKYITWKHLHEIKRVLDMSLFSYKLKSINSEEIILEIDKDSKIFRYLDILEWLVPVKRVLFDIKIVQNYGDNVVVKEILDESFNLKYKTLSGVNGHRFYLHFKTLILNGVLDDRDILFKQENKTFIWCGEYLKDYREYNYVKKWIKPLLWSNDFAYVHKGEMLYSILDKKIDYITLYDIKEKTEHILKLKKSVMITVSEYHYDKIKKYIY